jgi:two-component system response regulator PilR (NtrC family)
VSLPPPPRVHLLFVDDDENQRTLHRRLFEHFGYAVTSAASAHEALLALETPGIDLVVTDWNMPDQNGIALATAIHARWPGLPIILLTGYGVADAERAAAGSGITRVIGKPVMLDELRTIVNATLKTTA